MDQLIGGGANGAQAGAANAADLIKDSNQQQSPRT